MPNIVDELLVTLGLDASKFRIGADEVERQSKKVRDKTTRDFSEIEKMLSQGLGLALTKVTTGIISFFAALVGARELTEFAAKVTHGAVSLGMLSETLGMTPERISSIEMAVERLGGTGEGAASSLTKLNDVIFRYRTFGETQDWVKRLGLNPGDMKNAEDFMEKIIQHLQALGFKTQTQKMDYLRAVGLDPYFAELYTRPGGINQARKEISMASVDEITKGQVESAKGLQQAWEQASQAVEALGRKLLTRINPYLVHALNQVTVIAQGGPFEQPKSFEQTVINIALAVKSINELGDALEQKIIAKVREMTDELGGWTGALGGVSTATNAFGDTLTMAAAKWAGTIEDKIGGAITGALKRWNEVEKFITEHLAGIEEKIMEAAKKAGLGGAGTEIGLEEAFPGYVGTIETPKPGGSTTQEDWLAKANRMGGVPIQVGGMLVTEGTPVPVHIVGPMQGTAGFNLFDWLEGVGGGSAAAPPSVSAPAAPSAEKPPVPAAPSATNPTPPVTVGPSATVRSSAALPSPGDRGGPMPAAPSPSPENNSIWGTLKSWLPSFAEGGSFTVGGREGRDANPVMLMLTKGERVDITSNNKPSRALTSQMSSDRWDLLREFLGRSKPDFKSYVSLFRTPLGQEENGVRNRSMLGESNSFQPAVIGQHNWAPSLGAYNQQDAMISPPSLGGAGVGATQFASTLTKNIHQTSTNVNVANISFASEQIDRTKDLMTNLNRYVFAVQTDVGLA